MQPVWFWYFPISSVRFERVRKRERGRRRSCVCVCVFSILAIYVVQPVDKHVFTVRIKNNKREQTTMPEQRKRSNKLHVIS